MLNEFSFTKFEEEEDIGNIWFQQDGATSHTAEAKLCFWIISQLSNNIIKISMATNHSHNRSTLLIAGIREHCFYLKKP